MQNRQHPINSPFNAFSIAADVLAGIDLTRKAAIITGGYCDLAPLYLDRAITSRLTVLRALGSISVVGPQGERTVE